MKKYLSLFSLSKPHFRFKKNNNKGKEMYLNEYFKREEFSCKCGCGFDTVDVELLNVLTDVRKHFNKPVFITSGCRCDSHNKKVGGAVNSVHKLGKACDIKVKDISPILVFEYLEEIYPDTLGIGLYKSWIHVDSRDNRSRWNNS